jgi:hypothetical protein
LVSDDDPRLDQRNNLTAWAESLEDVLARLSRETGVKLAFAGHDIGDQRINAVLEDQPLRRGQELLAETLGLSWLRDRKAPGYRYVLYHTPHLRVMAAVSIVRQPREWAGRGESPVPGELRLLTDNQRGVRGASVEGTGEAAIGLEAPVK